MADLGGFSIHSELFPTKSTQNGLEVTNPQYSQTQSKPTALSEIQQLKRENEQLKEQLTQAQKLTALGELVGTTTHEFNNVLMTIINYAKMGMRHEDPEIRNKAFSKILAGGERAAKITNSVLGMARNRSENFELTCIGKLIEESLVLLERELRKYRIEIELDIAEVPKAPVIGNQIQQVLMNLLINSRQAMPEGGRLILRLKFDQQAKTVDISVRDYGTGIPQDKLRKIFDPYFTTKAGPDETGKGGTGLGLAACKNIIDAHGGKIRVESSVGKGTCITIKLPTTRQSVPAPKFPGVVNQASSTTTPVSR